MVSRPLEREMRIGMLVEASVLGHASLSGRVGRLRTDPPLPGGDADG